MPNAYPALPIGHSASGQWVGTKITPRFGRQERVASNGAVRIRLLQSAPKYDVTVFHGHLTQAQRDSLISFYNANAGATILFTPDEDGIERTYVFAAQGYAIEPNANGGYTATVYLRET